MDVSDLPHCEISGRSRYDVDGKYDVENGRLGRYRVTVRETGIEYTTGLVGVENPIWEFDVVSKRGRRKSAYPMIVSTRTLNPLGPRARELTRVARAVIDYEMSSE